jgi:AsmA protein
MKWLKWAVWAAVAVVLVLVVVIGIFVATFDPNAYKARITQGVQEATGRELAIEGEIGLTFFPLGFSLGETRLSNAAGFGDMPFASVEEVAVRVAILPLLKNEVRIDRVVLRGLSLDLQRNAQGVTNWDDLVPAPGEGKDEAAAQPAEAPASQPAEARPLPTIWIGGVDVSAARVSWRDAQAGTEIRLDPFNLHTGAFAFGEPMPLHMDLRLEQGSPVTVLTAALDAEVTADPAAGAYRVADLVLDVAASGRDIPAGRVEARLSADLVANLEAQTAEVSGLRLQTLGMQLTGQAVVTELLGELKVNGSIATDRFSPRDLMQRLAIAVPETSDGNVLNKAELRAGFTATPDSAALEDLTVVLDDTTLEGTASVAGFARPAVRFGLVVDAINVDRYLPPTPEPAPVPAAGAAAADTPIELPMALLRSLDLDGTADVGEVIVGGIVLSDIHATLAAKNGLIRVDPLGFGLYGGVVNGKASLDARGDSPVYRSSLALRGMDMGALQADMLNKVWLTGQTEMDADITTSGDRLSALKRGLNGDLRFAFKDGAIQDEKLARIVRLIETTIYEDKTAGEGGAQEVRFTSLTGTAAIRNGVVSNRDLHVLTPILQAKGEGSVNLVENRMNYSFGVAKLGGSRTYLYTTVKGPLDDLSYNLDLERFAKDKLGDKVEAEVQQKQQELKQDLEEKVKDKLKGLFGR